MPVIALRTMSPSQVRKSIGQFGLSYVGDWNSWLTETEKTRPLSLGPILRRWQATRPHKMRRCRGEALHTPPYMEDLYREALPALRRLNGVDVSTFHKIRSSQENGLRQLWKTFEKLPLNAKASCVGITKAIMLLTDGRIGPALDSVVRKNIEITKPETADEWIQTLRFVAEDILAFENRWGVRLKAVVPQHFRHIECGRLYDMILGPQ